MRLTAMLMSYTINAQVSYELCKKNYDTGIDIVDIDFFLDNTYFKMSFI